MSFKRAVNAAMDFGKPTLINAVIDPAAGSESGRIGNLNPQSTARARRSKGSGRAHMATRKKAKAKSKPRLLKKPAVKKTAAKKSSAKVVTPEGEEAGGESREQRLRVQAPSRAARRAGRSTA